MKCKKSEKNMHTRFVEELGRYSNVVFMRLELMSLLDGAWCLAKSTLSNYQ